MSILAYQDGNINVKKNSILFAEGQAAQSVNILLQGKVDVFMSKSLPSGTESEDTNLKKSFRLCSIDQNMLLGTEGLFLNREHFFTYHAREDTIIYVFCTPDSEKLTSLFDSKGDYGAYTLTSIASLINLSHSALIKLKIYIEELSILTANLKIYFWHLKQKIGFDHTPSDAVLEEAQNMYMSLLNSGFSFSDSFSPAFFEEAFSSLYNPTYPSCDLSEDMLEYYRRLLDVPLDSRKSFFSSDSFITSYHCTEASKFLRIIQEELRSTFCTAEKLLKDLYSGGDCIFSEYIKAASGVKLGPSETYDVFRAIDYISSKIKEWKDILINEYKYSPEIDYDILDSIVDHTKLGKSSPLSSVDATEKGLPEDLSSQVNIPEELKDSVYKIIKYSDIPGDRAELFMANLEAFRHIRSRMSFDDESVNIRRNVSQVFFEIYEAVLKKVLLEKSQVRLYHMFLLFGYMDERLIRPEHTIALYNLVDRFSVYGQASVYNMRDWLSSIYDTEKDPSMNEFSQDYFDIFREMKKRREVTEKDRAKYSNDKDARLSFEIRNMFKVNHRVCYGQPGSYFPVLYDGMIVRDLEKSIVTPNAIMESVEKLLETDFSAFHREISYRNPEKGIEKELIMKSILPDFILMPVFGSRGIMWQEIAGRNRSTPARFILPVFTTENLDDLIVKLVGNFRWELCRTMMGSAWNDITQKSLTSEYTDYIQFYKKNKDLAEDAKEKVASQIQKHRNMMRDIFTYDYEQWINYESKGIIRMNKVARNILFRHCPFPKATREHLSKHPMFSDLATQFRNMRAKQAREIKNRYHKLSKLGISPDPDMEANLYFYSEM